MPQHPVKPCSQCPFRRDIESGYLGGSNPLVYVGQTQGPFVLNCHQAEGYEGNATPDVMAVPQCAGAAIFRANTGLCDRMPSGIHWLPEDLETVFTSHEEFVAHHTGMSIKQAESLLDYIGRRYLLSKEMQRNGVRKAV